MGARQVLSVLVLVLVLTASKSVFAQSANSATAIETINPLTGPSFQCPKPADPLAQLFCTSPDLALLDMKFSQTYYALYQQVGPAGDGPLRTEDIALETSIRHRCGIAFPEGNSPLPPPPAPPDSDRCVIEAYMQQIELWKGRLDGPALEEANRSVPDQIAIQSKLRDLGFLPPHAQLDSIFGPGTRAAIMQWQTSVGRQPTGILGDQDAHLLLATNGPVGAPAANVSQSQAPSVEQAWEPYIPYAGCMAQHGFFLQTFVEQGVPPTDPIAAQAIQACTNSAEPPSSSDGNDINSSTTSAPPVTAQTPQSNVQNTPSGSAIGTGIKLGDSVIEGPIQITVTSLNLLSQVGTNFFSHPASQGGVLVAVQYSFKNTGNQPVSADSQPECHLLDGNNVSYDSDEDASTDYSMQIGSNQKVISDLNPGITTMGSAVFEVSSSSLNTTTWHIYFGDDQSDIFSMVSQ